MSRRDIKDDAHAPFWIARIVVGLVAMPFAALLGLLQASSFTSIDLGVLVLVAIASWGLAIWLAQHFRLWPFR